MSEENVEIVRKAMEAYARGDLATALTTADPNVAWNPVEEAAGQGQDAIRANIERWETDWEDYEATPEEYIDAGDQVLVTIHWSGRGRGSGLQVDIRTYMIFTLRGGTLIRMDEFTERSEALEAAGLSEWAMSEKNVDAVRRAIETWNSDDFEAYLELVEELAHPDLEWYAVIAQMVEGQDSVYRGPSGMRRFWEEWHEVFDFHFEDTDIREVSGKVVVLTRAVVKGRGSGVDLETPLAMVLTFEGDRLIHEVSFLDHAEALKAAGLSE